MIDHVSVRVQDFDKLVAFYRDALAPIGYKVMMTFPGAVGLGSEMPDLWLMQTDKPLNPTHVALSGSRAAIDAFHAAALAAGGEDNGQPGLRADYHPHYYAAFVRDPEGNNIEIVCHEADGVPAHQKAMKASAKSSSKKAPAKKSARPAGKSAAKAKAKKAAPQAKKAAAKSKKPAKKKR
ncbi:MAG TPA: VOC family protein [Polyangia bacterium]|nr:VOC family protein [Polyangia bacterium]